MLYQLIPPVPEAHSANRVAMGQIAEEAKNHAVALEMSGADTLEVAVESCGDSGSYYLALGDRVLRAQVELGPVGTTREAGTFYISKKEDAAMDLVSEHWQEIVDIRNRAKNLIGWDSYEKISGQTSTLYQVVRYVLQAEADRGRSVHYTLRTATPGMIDWEDLIGRNLFDWDERRPLSEGGESSLRATKLFEPADMSG